MERRSLGSCSGAFAPGYVGGWTALHHWDLTDQIFSTTVFITARPVPRRRREIGGRRFELRHRSESALFGTRRVWRERVPVDVSDRERTLVDCLDDPSLGGGVEPHRRGAFGLRGGTRVSWDRLIEYADRLGNRTIFKRLGFLAEIARARRSQAGRGLPDRVSAGVGRLDPAQPDAGPNRSLAGDCGSTPGSTDDPPCLRSGPGRGVGADRGDRREGLRPRLAALGDREPPDPADQWVFKGGTCLKKCFVETYRFSEDLDFTVQEGGPLAPDDLVPVLEEMLDQVEQENGHHPVQPGAGRASSVPTDAPRRGGSTTADRGARPVRRE